MIMSTILRLIVATIATNKVSDFTKILHFMNADTKARICAICLVLIVGHYVVMMKQKRSDELLPAYIKIILLMGSFF